MLERLDEYIEFAEATKNFSGAAFYKELWEEIIMLDYARFDQAKSITMEEHEKAMEKQREACAKAAWNLLDPVNYPKFSQDFKRAILNARSDICKIEKVLENA